MSSPSEQPRKHQTATSATSQPPELDGKLLKGSGGEEGPEEETGDWVRSGILGYPVSVPYQ